LSDDRIILRCLDGRIWMYGTPWHGEAEFGCPARSPLTQIFFLGRGVNEMIPVPPPQAVARLMACSFVPFYNASALHDALAFLERVTGAVRSSELRFAPDDRMLEFVRRYARECCPSIQSIC
jgi:hypothetical protein